MTLLARQAELESADLITQAVEDEFGISENTAKRLGEQFQTALEHSNLTKKEKIQLVGSIDENLTAKNINEVIRRLNNGDSIDNIVPIIAPDLSSDAITEHRYSSEEREKILEDAGLSESGFAEYLEKLRENSTELNKALIENKERVKDLEQQLTNIEPDPRVYRELSAELEKTTKEGNALAAMLDQIGMATVETQNGLNKLSKITDEEFDALRNGVITSSDYISAIEKMKPAIANTLNVDESDINGDFIISHLEEIYKLVNGDLEVIDDLRIALGETFAANIELD